MKKEIEKHLRSGVNLLTFDKFNKIKTLNKNTEYNEFLKGKSVIIVGPSSHLFKKENQKYIDAFDVVVRVNKSFPVKKDFFKFIGSRTDVLYHCLNQSEIDCGKIHYDSLEKNNVILATPYPKFLLPFHRDYERFEKEKINKDIKTNYINIDFYNKFMKSIGTRPNSGISAIADLMCYDIRRLHICGFTFFETGFHKGYRKVNGMKENKDGSTEWLMFDKNFNNNHIQSLQKEFVKMLLNNDERITVDIELENILL